jgi:transcriptional regulator GlxA family with amidase domain
MHPVTFIVYPGFELLDTAGPASAFNSANRALSQAGKPAFYNVARHRLTAAASKAAAAPPSERDVSPSFGPAMRRRFWSPTQTGATAAGGDGSGPSWLPSRIGRESRTLRFRSGGFLLAALGLLDGHRVAAHWDSCKPLAKTFPAITVDPDALYVSTDGCGHRPA